MILRAHRGEFGVQRFLEAVRRFDVVAPVQEGLRFVAEVLGEGAHIFEQVRSLRRSRFSERAFKARATAYENRSIADRITLRIEAALWAQRATRGAS